MRGERVGFTGHQGLTRQTELLVRSAIQRSLSGLKQVTGISSLAEGSDQIFAQTLLAAGGELIVIVPCHGYDRTFTDPSALASYHELLAKAHRVIRLEHPEPSEEAYWDAGKQIVRQSDRIIAVWDGQPAGGLGGTADVVNFAHEQNKHVDVIWPDNAARA